MAEVGDTIAGRYRVIAELGRGGMGIVVRARDEKLGRDVAVKLLPPAGGESARRRMVREARSAATLTHPGIIQVHDVGESEGGEMFVVMELVRGESLRDVLSRGALPLDEAVRITGEVASALDAAHARQIVHRDIKPDNVMMRPDGRVVVLDFGIAKPIEAGPLGVAATQLTHEGTLIGTPAYIAPEQAHNKAGPEADQFSLAVMAYELLTGRLPWRGTTALAVLSEILSETPPPPSTHRPEIPAEIDAAIARAMARDPRQRFSDVRAFADALCGVSPSEGDDAPRPSADQRQLDAALTATAPADLEGALAKTAQATRQRRPVRFALGLFAVLLAIGSATGWLAWRRKGHAAAPAPVRLDARSRIACPLLRVTGAPEPSGWLGAAAATAVCRRLAWYVDGRFDQRFAIPADLLGLPRLPRDDFPRDPFAASDVPARTLDAARARGGAWIDGEVRAERGRLRVHLEAHDASGAAIGEADGEGVALFQAVASAVDVIAPHIFPDSVVIAPAVTTAIGVTSIAEGLEHQVCIDSEPSPESDARFRRAWSPGIWDTLALCDRRSALPAGELGVLLTKDWSRVDRASPDDLSDVRARATKLLGASPTPEAGVRLAILRARVESRLGLDTDARSSAALAIEIDVRNGPAWFGYAQIATFMRGEEGATRAWSAWTPDAAAAWADLAIRSADPAERVDLLERGRTLSPRSNMMLMDLGGALVEAGRLVEARAVAAELSSVPNGAGSAELVLVRADANEARFDAALGRAMRALEGQERLGREVFVYQMLWMVGEIATVLGKEREIAGRLVRRFVLPDPAPLEADPIGLLPLNLLMLCAMTGPEARAGCADRIATLRKDGTLPFAIPGVDVLATALHQGDDRAASRALAPLVRSDVPLHSRMATALGPIFERAGEDDLADRVDAPLLERHDFNGVTLAHARTALRARRRGDNARAAELARRVVDAWSTADATVPVLVELRRIASTTR